MIVAVCSDKGSPGVSTVAMALGMVWPGDRVVLDADTAGGDLPFRLWTADREQRLAPSPSVAELATAARLGLSEAGPGPFTQACSLGVPVVPGMLSADRFRPLRGLWPRVAAQLAAWPGTVIADLGRLQPGNPAAPVAGSATAVLVLTRVDLEGLAHLRERVVELAAAVGDPGRDRIPVGVVVTGPPRNRSFAVQQVRQVLLSIGSPVPVVGHVAQDPAGARALWDGQVTRRLAGSELVRSARSVAESVLTSWPALLPPRPADTIPDTDTATDTGAAGGSPVLVDPEVARWAPPVGGATVVTSGSVDYELVRVLRERVADRMTRVKQDRDRRGAPELSATDEQQLAFSLITEAVQQHQAEVLTGGRELPADPGDDLKLIMAVDAAMYRAGELQELLDDDLVENIDINGCDEVFVTYADGRGKVRGAPIAASDDELIGIVQNLASYAGLNARPFTRANPELDLRLPDGSRLSAVMAASERPIVSIRRNRYPQMFLRTLVELGTVTDQVACFLHAAVRARMNIVVAGATDAGKTTLLRALINCIPPDERLITVERALELGLRRHPDLHADVVELEEVLPDADGQGGLSIRELVRRTRRHNPSRVIVGEVLGPEVVEMLSAMSQGNNGSLSTLHARSGSDVFAKLAQYAGQYEHVDFGVAQGLIAGAVDFVVFMAKNRLAGGRRCVTQVLEVAGAPDGRVASSTIFTASPTDGRAVRAAEVPIGADRRAELWDAGYDDTDTDFVYDPAPGWPEPVPFPDGPGPW